MRTARYTLNQAPRQVDVAPDARDARSVTVFAQGTGTIVICDDAATDPTVAGARWPVTAGAVLPFSDIGGREDVWLACESGTLDVDVVELGLDS